MRSDRPKVSVLLPVHNGRPYLQAAVESILGQTEQDLELIAINDGSVDGSGDLLDQVSDSRIRVVHQRNAGLAATLNRAISLARGEYLARQDADDISLPERFAKQVAFLDSNPACALVGTWSSIWQADCPTERGHRHPCENGELQYWLLFDSYFVHSSVMIRRVALNEVGAYPTDLQRCPPEDFDLWSRIARRFEVANLPEVLQIYRELPNSISRARAELLQARAINMSVENLQYLIGTAFSEKRLKELAGLLRGVAPVKLSSVSWSEMQSVLAEVERRLVARFPSERTAIARPNAAAMEIVRQARSSQHSPLKTFREAMKTLARRTF